MRGRSTHKRLRLPKGRSNLYAIWRACERFGIRPPGVRSNWEDCNVQVQSELLAFDQIRTLDDAETFAGVLK